MKKHLDSWSKELDKREAFIDRCRKILKEEKKKNDVTNTLLQRASEGQEKEDKNDSRLVEEHQVSVPPNVKALDNYSSLFYYLDFPLI